MANLISAQPKSLKIPKPKKLSGRQVAAIKEKNNPTVSKILGVKHSISEITGKARMPPAVVRNPLYAERGPLPGHYNVRNPASHLEKLLHE